MVCPVCVVSAGVGIACKFFGVPDILTGTIIGVLMASLGYSTSIWFHKKGYNRKVRIYILNNTKNKRIRIFSKKLFSETEINRTSYMFVLIYIGFTVLSYQLMGWICLI